MGVFIAGEGEGDLAGKIEHAFLAALGKAKPKLAKVDMPALMEEKGLSAFFPVQCWPPSAAVRELATKLKATARQLGAESWTPFVKADLKK